MKELIGSKGYARFLKAQRDSFEIDVEKAREEEKYDGLWLLRTNTPFEARETALRYKQPWLVEQTFRTAKALLDTRPAFHRTDATIRGHVFCSFLAMVLQKELFLKFPLATSPCNCPTSSRRRPEMWCQGLFGDPYPIDNNGYFKSNG